MSNTTEITFMDHYSKAYDVLLAVLCVLGLFGNSLSAYIFLLPKFRSQPVNILLAALSLSDLLIIILFFFVFDLYLPKLLPHQWALYVVIYCYPIWQMFHCFSIWLLVAVTAERFLAVSRPLMVRSICTRKRAKLITCSIAVLSLSFNVVRFWEYRFQWNPQFGLSYPAFDLLRFHEYKLWYSTIATIALIYVVPLLTIIVLNTRVIRQLQKAHVMRQNLQAAPGPVADQKTTLMLLYVTLCFILCYSLALGLNVVEWQNPTFFRTSFGRILNDLNNGLVVVNASTTWLIYWRFSTRYRNAAKATAPWKPKINEPSEQFELLSPPLTHSRCKTSTQMENLELFEEEL